MQKLIKLSDQHYVVADDTNEIRQSVTSDKDYWSSRVDYKKITHSTQPFNFDWIEPLSLSEVEEVIYGYSVEKMANDYCKEWEWERILGTGSAGLAYDSFVQGFKAHQELVKDKMFTKEDMIRLAIHCWNIASRPTYGAIYNVNEIAEDFMKPLFPKTEWNIEIDKQGKIKLI